MLIHIVFDFSDSASGGGNQFLKALKDQLIELGFFTNNIESSDIVLFNSHHKFLKVAKYRSNFKDIIFIHRVAGPMRIQGNTKDPRDSLVKFANLNIANATIFQSEWSKIQNQKFGNIKMDLPNIIIKNASNNRIFYKDNSVRKIDKKVKLINVSFSSNKNKGFDDLLWLDQNLDFNNFQFTFVGNTNVFFKNIEVIEPMSSIKLASILREHHIYFSPSRNETCSNAIIEAQQCGLPVIAKNSGGTPELVSKEMLYDCVEESIFLLNKCVENYKYYIEHLPSYNIQKAANLYIDYFVSLLNLAPYKKTSNLIYFKAWLYYIWWKSKIIFRNLFK